MPQPLERGVLDRLYRFFFGTSFIQKELLETEELYWRVVALRKRTEVGQGAGPFDAACAFAAGFISRVPTPLTGYFLTSIRDVLALETALFDDVPEIADFESIGLREGVELRELLRKKAALYANEKQILGILNRCINGMFGGTAELIPDVAEQSPFTIQVIHTIQQPRGLIGDIIKIAHFEECIEAGLFAALRRRFYLNMCALSGIAPDTKTSRPLKWPSENDAPLSEIVPAYLGGTPFAKFLMAPVPLKLTNDDRFAHTHIVGGSGVGKTQLLQSLILHDLQAADSPAMVVVDSQGDLIDTIAHLDIGIEDRLVLITPKDIEHPPALNVFDVNRRRFSTYDAAAREQITAGVIQTFDYLFSGLLGADLTAKQGVLFRYVARLMLTIPDTMGRNATILDMIRLMDDPAPYMPAIEALPEIPRGFFLREFKERAFDQTKEQVRYRLHAIIENPTLARLFTSPSTKIDLFTELNRGSIILVDTAKDFLKGASSHFGRIFIALTLQAVLERAAIPERNRRDAFLFVDEAAEYFDDNIDDLLTETRKYKLGCVFAHQYLDQCTPSLRASLAANTAIKMASGVSTRDARELAPDMRTTPDFILSQPRLHFACHIRNVTPQAVSIPVEAGKMEAEPRMSDEAYARFEERNRERVSFAREPEPPPEPEPAPTAKTQPEPKPPPAAPPRSERKRPKKRHVPLVGDIDTSA